MGIFSCGYFFFLVISPTQFSISVDTTGSDYGAYVRGGQARQIKQPHSVTFVRGNKLVQDTRLSFFIFLSFPSFFSLCFSFSLFL